MRSDEPWPRAKHGSPVPGGQGFWWVDRLWALSADLPPFRIRLDDVVAFDSDCWFDGQEPPTLRAVARHAARINAVDLSFPVILSADGVLMDGAHRLAKSWTEGQDWVLAVQFDRDPEPDWVEPEAS
jgi:hypothetical protein